MKGGAKMLYKICPICHGNKKNPNQTPLQRDEIGIPQECPCCEGEGFVEVDSDLPSWQTQP